MELPDGGKNLIDKYVVDIPYPGIVTDEDNDHVEVKCMFKVGNNRFYWPMHKDIILCCHKKDSIVY